MDLKVITSLGLFSRQMSLLLDTRKVNRKKSLAVTFCNSNVVDPKDHHQYMISSIRY